MIRWQEPTVTSMLVDVDPLTCVSKAFCLLKSCGSTRPQMPEHHCTFIIPLPLSFFAVSSCITTYKKTPPPVPPRTSTCSTASKPYISITAQSSTESAQVSHKSPLYPATASEFQPFIFMGFKPLNRLGDSCWKCSAAWSSSLLPVSVGPKQQKNHCYRQASHV